MKRFVLLALLVLGVSALASAADFSFGPPVRVALARNVYTNVATGDVNGDGRDDLVSTAIETFGAKSELAVFLQRPDGTLAAPLKMALTEAWNEHKHPVVVVDLDNDGKDEIVTGSGVGPPGLLVTRYGAGALSMSTHATIDRDCAFIAAGHVDDDAFADVVCHDWKETAHVFRGDGAGGFRSPLRFRTAAAVWVYDEKQLKLADVTGDGRDDLLLTGSGNNSFYVHPNNGLGAFWPATAYSHPWSPSSAWPLAIEVIDLDGDGVLEVVTSSPDNAPRAAVNVYRRGTNGLLALSERIPTQSSPTALVVRDVDGDGDSELLAGHFSFNEVTLFGNAAPGLAGQARFDLPGFGNDVYLWPRQVRSNSLAFGDLNHDDCQDLAAATYSGLQVLYGCRPAGRKKLPVSDFDGDGVSDLLFVYDDKTGVHLWWWADIIANYECSAQLYPSSICPYTGDKALPRASGDFDGDGNSDTFLRNASTGENALRDRAFHRRSISSVTDQNWQVAGTGDFDGDDRSDLLWRHRVTGANTIWKSADSTTGQSVASADTKWTVAGIGDFDGDRRSDILWRHAATGQNAIWLAGVVETPRAVAAVSVQWKIAGVGDFNGDGKDDIVWRNATTGVNTIWRSADHAASLTVSTVADQAWFIAAVGDYNGDGRADLFWRNSGTGANVIWRSADSRNTQAVAPMSPLLRVLR